MIISCLCFKIQFSKREKQVVLLMIPNREGWHYLYSFFRIKNKLKPHKRSVKIKILVTL